MQPANDRDTDPLAFLSGAGDLLAASLDYEETLARVARLVVPALADACSVELLDGDGLRPVAGAHVDPVSDEVHDALGWRLPLGPARVATVLRTGEPVRWSLSEGEGVAIAAGPQDVGLPNVGAFRSGLVVPLVAHGSAIGVLSLVSAVPGRYTDADLAVAADLGRRCGLAIDNATLYREAQEALAARDAALAEAESERGRLRAQIRHTEVLAEDLHRLASAALAFTAAGTREEVLRVVTDQAPAIIGAHHAATVVLGREGWRDAAFVSFLSDRYARWRDVEVKPDGSGLYAAVLRDNRTLRLTQEELDAHPEWRSFAGENGSHPPLRGVLAAPVRRRDGTASGLLLVSDKFEGEFNTDDEAILVQLAQMASVALENTRLVDEAQESYAQLDILLTSAPIGLAFLDPELCYLRMNDSLAAIYGVTVDGSLRRKMAEVVPGMAAAVEPLLREVLTSGRPVVNRHVTGTVSGRPDEATYLVVSCYPVRGADGAVAGVGQVVSDVTGRRRAELDRERLLVEVETQRTRLEAVLQQLPDGVVIAEAPRGRLVLANRRAEQLVGPPVAEHSAGPEPGVFRPARPDGTPYDPAELPLLRSARDGTVVTGEEIDVLRPDGTPATLSVSSRPVRDRAGRVVSAVATFTDITERKRRERHLRLLSEASRVLASSLDYHETLNSVARLVLQSLATYCLIDVLEDDGSVRRVVAESSDPSKAEIMTAFRDRFPPHIGRRGGSAIVLRTGQPVLVPVVDESFFNEATDGTEEERDLARSMGLTSVMIVPMTARGRTVGAISLGAVARTGRYDDYDLALAEELGRRAGLAIDNARLYRAERLARGDAEAAAKQLHDLMAVTDTALAHMALDDLMDVVLDRVGEILAVDVMTVWLLDADGQSLVVEAARNFDEARNVRLALGEGLAGLVAVERRAHSIDDVLATEGVHPVVRDKGVRSLFGVPLLVEGQVIGALVVGSLTPRRLTSPETTLLQLAADRAALAIEHARRFKQEHTVAETLQRSLLPELLPRLPGVEVAVRYVAGAAGTDVGGDWYDVVSLPAGRLGVMIGDVVGRGIRAASIMGQLRNALRAYALEGHSPAQAVGRLDRLVEAVSPGVMATLLYAVFDPASGALRFTSAGHPPPLVLDAAGATRFIEGARSVPVGAMVAASFAEAEFTLGAGDRLVLYTDGLVEERGVPIDDGLARLAAAARSGPDDIDELCDHLLASMLPEGEQSDDVALLVLRSNRPVPKDDLRLRLDAEPAALATVRAALRQWLAGLRAGEMEAFDVITACGEAAANAVEHAYGPAPATFEVAARAEGDEVVVVVRDRGRWRPPRGNDRGRGLGLMRALMDAVEVAAEDDGTEVRMRRRLAGDDG